MSAVEAGEEIPEGISGLGLPLGRRIRLEGRGTTFVREVTCDTPNVPTVVLLHGWFASGGLNWFNVFEPLSKHFNIVAPDMRGHGRGLRRRRRFRLNDCADDLAVTMDELGIDNAIMCGFSMGGPVAQLMWKRHPEKVSGLVFSATSVSFIPGLQQRLIFAGAMGVAAGTTRVFQPTSWLPKTVRSKVPAPLRQGKRPSSIERWAGQEMRRHDARMLLEAGTAISTFSSTRWIGDVDVPTTVLVTTRDKAIPPHDQLKLALAIPHAEILRYEEGHTCPALESFGPAITEAVQSVAEKI